MAAEAGFTIDGAIYEVPTIDSFDMDETQILYDYSGLTLESFSIPPNESAEEAELREKQYDNPGFMRSLMHIAYQRAHREIKPATIKQLISSAKYLDAVSTLGSGEDEEGDALPPESTTEPAPSSESASDESKPTSGSDSPTGSVEQVSSLHRIGTTRSDTYSPESPTRTSVG